jgi:enamine deaminase RidA (YjgF/YER057c/UK114 family)
MAKIERSCAGKRGPASTPVAALAHPDWLIEVEAIAVV